MAPSLVASSSGRFGLLGMDIRDEDRLVGVHSFIHLMLLNSVTCLILLQDKDGSESECRWCGHGGAVICCGACAKVICRRCIFRNFGAATLSAVVSSSDWRCPYCNPEPLKNLVQQFKQVEEEVGRLNILDDEDVLSDKELIIKQVSRCIVLMDVC